MNATATRERCTSCGLNFPLKGAICHPCSTSPGYNQDQDQDQDQDQGFSEQPSPPPGPGCNDVGPLRARPGCNSDDDDGPELHRLEEAHHLGELRPVDVQLGEMPPHAGPVMRAVAEHVRVRMGLRRAAGDDRPLPYAASEAVRAGLAKDKPTASRAIRALVRAGVIEHVGQLPPLRPGLDGTKLYAPPRINDEGPAR